MSGIFWRYELFSICSLFGTIGKYQAISHWGDISMKSYFATFIGLLAICSFGQTASAQLPAGPNVPYPVQIPAGATLIPASPSGIGLQPIPVMGGPSAPGMVMPAAHFAGMSGCDIPCDAPCDGACGGCCQECCAAGGGYAHAWYFYGEFLYLRPRDSEVAWATPANSNFPTPPNTTPVQIGPLGVVDQDFQPGWKAGFQYNMTECTGISAQYTMYEATTNDFVAITGANVVESLVSHPSIDTTAQNFRQGQAAYAISYDLVDIDYHQLLWYDCDYQIGFLAGVGVVQMEQNLVASLTGTGTETVRTDIDFYGAGARFGLEGEGGGTERFRVYAKGIGSLIAGEFRADYDLGHSFDAVVIDTGWRAGRIVGIWNLEMGLKWISRCGNYSGNVGYLFSAWTNTVQTDQWIHGVQTNYFADLDDTMTFDGLVARFEARF